MTLTLLTSVACERCHSGRYAAPSDPCPTCGGSVRVTDRIRVVDLNEWRQKKARPGPEGDAA